MSGLLRLYPAAWRERYEAEFLGLLGLRMTLRGSATIHDAPSSPRVPEVPAT